LPSILSDSSWTPSQQKSKASPVMGSRSSRMTAFEATKAQAEAEGTWSFRTASRSPARWQPRPWTAFEMSQQQAAQDGTWSFRTASRSPSPRRTSPKATMATRFQMAAGAAAGYFWTVWKTPVESQPQAEAAWPKNQADLPRQSDSEEVHSSASESLTSTAQDLQCLQEELEYLRMQNETLKMMAEQVPLDLSECQESRSDKECDWPSRGSRDHPHACAQPCKFFYSAKGCKDGDNCERCHMCPWKGSAANAKTKRPFWRSRANQEICLPVGQVR